MRPSPSFASSGPERILCAALHVDTGKDTPARRTYNYPKTGLLFAGHRHPDCFTTLDAYLELLPGAEAERLTLRRVTTQGFLTSTGRYVSREEAATLAFAAGQITAAVAKLYSEDLY